MTRRVCDRVVVTLYRAEGIPHEFTSIVAHPDDRTKSWTSCESAAHFYCERHGGTEVVTVTLDSPKVLDLRYDPGGVLRAEVGIEWGDYEWEPLHDLSRALAEMLRSEYDWVAFFGDAPKADWDEWLELNPRSP